MTLWNTPTESLLMGKDTPLTSVLNMTLNHLMVRFQTWGFGECGVPLQCPYSQVHSDPVRIPFMGQIEIFNHCVYLKTFNSAQKITTVELNNYYYIAI